MSLDLTESFGSIQDKIRANKTYTQVLSDTKKLEREQKNNLEQAKKSVTTTVDKLKDQKKRFQRQVKTQIDQLVGVLQSSSGNGSATMRYLKTKFIQAAVNIEPKVFELLFKEVISTLGCSQQQAYPDNQVIYIKVQSTDLVKLLKRDPNEEVAAVAYEKSQPQALNFPYSMNREMWDRLQVVGQQVPIYGKSGRELFKISYEQLAQPGNITGDFFRIELQKIGTNFNKVGDFLFDYYKSIRIIDMSNLFQQLIDQISGAVSFEANIGTGELEVKSKFMLILQRILGLCFDNTKEIDVGGNSKVPELDGIDESFFEFTDIDLRMIEEQITNIKHGVVEFEDCGNVKLPVDTRGIMDNLLKFNQATNDKEIEELADKLTDTLSEDDRWKLIVPNNVDIKLSLDLSFITNLPKAIMLALLSPKVLLPILIMLKAIGKGIGDLVENLLDFMKYFAKLVIGVMSKIGGLFVQELFEIIRKDIQQLISQIVEDIAKEAALKKFAIILRLIQLILIILKFIDDWRKCKSVVDEILQLLQLAGTGFSLPGFLVAASKLLGGFSASRGCINIIEELQKTGLPTGPMPDGSPNLMLIQACGAVKAVQKEENENGKVQIFVPNLTVPGMGGTTIPDGNVFGKKM